MKENSRKLLPFLWRCVNAKSMLIKGVLCCVLYSGTVQANLINTDFSNGFDNWSAEVSSYDFSTNQNNIESGDLFASYADNFGINGDQVTLSTTTDGIIDVYGVVLFQDVVFSAIGADSVLELSLNVLLSLTDNVDFGFVQLRDLSGNLATLDLLAGGTFDITDWIGVNATFEIGLFDNAFDLGDSLSISSLQVVERVNDVPAPAFMTLLGLMLLLLLQRYKGRDVNQGVKGSRYA